MSEFQVGQRVLICPIYNGRMDGSNASNSTMFKQYGGRIMTIHKIVNRNGVYQRYRMLEDDGRWCWYPGMIEPANQQVQVHRLPKPNLPQL